MMVELINRDNMDLLLCECKFTARLTGVREFRMLVPGGDENKRYIMFFLLRFTLELKDLAANEPGLRLELMECRRWKSGRRPESGARF